MKKKLLSFVFALCLIIPCAFMLEACGDKKAKVCYTITKPEVVNISLGSDASTSSSNSDEKGYYINKNSQFVVIEP